jgi:hypothetical protein
VRGEGFTGIQCGDTDEETERRIAAKREEILTGLRNKKEEDGGGE